MKVKISSFAALTVCLLFLSSGAFASSNLLTNGSFETGDFTGWNQTCSPSCGYPYNGVTSGAFYQVSGAEDGSYYAWLGDTLPGGSLSQSFATTVGTLYTFSFWINGEGDNPSALSAYWDGNTLLSLTNPNTGNAWQEYSFTETGTGSDNIEFAYNDPTFFFALDHVVVTSVPEPTTLAMLGSGILGLAGVLRRKIKL